MKKTLTRVQIKDADQGLVEAVFSTLGVVDKDGDLTKSDAFTEGAPVVISAYGHKSWDGELPVGHGTIHVVGNEAVLKGQFLLNTTHGRDTWETVKELSKLGLQEWSYSLHDVKASTATVGGRKVRVIERVSVKEVSPVLRGAGVDTHTIDVKQDRSERKQLESSLRRLLAEAGSARWSDSDTYVWVRDYDMDDEFVVYCVDAWDEMEERYTTRMIQLDFTRDDTSVTLGETETDVHPTTVFLPKSAKFSEHADAALAAVGGLVEMATKRLALRAEQGKSVDQQVAALEQLTVALSPLKAAVDALPTSQSIPADDLRMEYLRFVGAQL